MTCFHISQYQAIVYTDLYTHYVVPKRNQYQLIRLIILLNYFQVVLDYMYGKRNDHLGWVRLFLTVKKRGVTNERGAAV